MQADELGVEHLREHLPELGLSRPGRSLGKERLLEREGEEECRLHAARGDVARGTQAVADLLEGDLHLLLHQCSEARLHEVKVGGKRVGDLLLAHDDERNAVR